MVCLAALLGQEQQGENRQRERERERARAREPESAYRAQRRSPRPHSLHSFATCRPTHHDYSPCSLTTNSNTGLTEEGFALMFDGIRGGTDVEFPVAVLARKYGRVSGRVEAAWGAARERCASL